MKIFLRTNAFYHAESPQLQDDLEITGLATVVVPEEKPEEETAAEQDLTPQSQQPVIHAKLTETVVADKPAKIPIKSLSDFNDEHNKPAAVTSKLSSAKDKAKPTTTKAPAKKK